MFTALLRKYHLNLGPCGMELDTIVTAKDTVSTARQALILCQQNKQHQASQCLLKVKRNGEALLGRAKDMTRRIANFQKWLSNKQTRMSYEIDKLQRSEEKAKKDIEKLEEQNKYYDRLVREKEENIEEAQRREENALREKRNAEAKLREGSNPLLFLIPGYSVYWGIRELIENNASVASDAARDAQRYRSERKDLTREIENISERIDQAKDNAEELLQNIRSLRIKSDEEHAKLAEVRQIQQLIMKASKLCEELVELSEEAVDCTERLEGILKLANELEEMIEKDGALTNYDNAWLFIERLLQGEIGKLSFEFTCSRCCHSHYDFPWFINDDDEAFCKACCT